MTTLGTGFLLMPPLRSCPCEGVGTVVDPACTPQVPAAMGVIVVVVGAAAAEANSALNRLWPSPLRGVFLDGSSGSSSTVAWCGCGCDDDGGGGGGCVMSRSCV